MKAIDFTVSEHNSVSIVFIFGKLDLSSIANEKWFRIPEPLHFGIKFDLGPIVTISILCFIALVELMGDQASAAMLSEQRLPSSKESKGGIMAQGISSIISSMFNMVPTILGSANIGLCGITGVTSRYVVSFAGVVIAICSICPKLCAVFSVIPYPILGGVALTAFGTILVSGMNVIRNSELTSRETTIVFFARPFWRKLQNIFGECCISKLAKVAKLLDSLFISQSNPVG